MNTFEFLIAAILSSTVIATMIKAREKQNDKKYESRQRLIHDSKFFISRIGNIDYEKLGDFRKDMMFISIYQHFSKKLQKDFDLLKLHGESTLPSDFLGANEKERLIELLHRSKVEIAQLEDKWLRRRFRIKRF